MRDASERLGFAHEIRLRDASGADELERDLTVEVGIVCGVHDSHPTRPEAGENREAPHRCARAERRGRLEWLLPRWTTEAHGARAREVSEQLTTLRACVDVLERGARIPGRGLPGDEQRQGVVAETGGGSHRMPATS
jgi:hypothetical protein